MDTLPQSLLLEMDDQGFCDCLLAICQTGYDLDNALNVLYEPWVLQRLKLIQDRASHVYYGSFLAPLRRRFPRQVWPPDLLAAMRGVDELQDGALGDVLPEMLEHDVLALYEQGIQGGADPGWRNLADLYTVRPGEITIVTGIASHMKSTFVHALCLQLAEWQGWRFGLFSPEHFPPAYLITSFIEARTRMRIQTMPREMVIDVLGWVGHRFRLIQPPEEISPTLPYLLAVARKQVERYGIKGLVLDPWNEIDHQYGRQSETQYVSEALSKIRRFARHHQVHVWVVAHPAKMQKALSGQYEGKYPPPKPYDISGSAHWYNKADNCLCVWRDSDQDSPVIEVHVQKVRYRAVGHTGGCFLHYQNFRFVEA